MDDTKGQTINEGVMFGSKDSNIDVQLDEVCC